MIRTSTPVEDVEPRNFRPQENSAIDGDNSDSSDEDLKTALPNPDLIDIDLLKGSTFSEKKAPVSTAGLCAFIIKYYICLPLNAEFWLNQVSLLQFQVLLVIYFGQWYSLWFWFTIPWVDNAANFFISHRQANCEVFLPLLFLLNICVIHYRVRALQISEKELRVKNRQRLHSINFREKPRHTTSSSSSGSDFDATVASGSESYSSAVESLQSQPINTNRRASVTSCCSDRQGLDASFENFPLFRRTTFVLNGSRRSQSRPSQRFLKETPSYTGSSKIAVRIWVAARRSLPLMCQKIYLTPYEIANKLALVVNAKHPGEFSGKFWTAAIFSYSVVVACIPVVSRLLKLGTGEVINLSMAEWLFLAVGAITRVTVAIAYFFMLSLALSAFIKRHLYSKQFSRITSARRAKMHSIPHFRLKKIRNIKAWLTLRSYLRRRGPQRSVDIIVSSCFITSMLLLAPILFYLLQNQQYFSRSLALWEISAWCVATSIFLLKFTIIGSDINRRYLSMPIMITEQLNVYFGMESKPRHKESLQRANQVLTLLQKLLKEIEAPYRISGVVMSPLLFQVLRLVVLSAISGIVREMIGVNPRLYSLSKIMS